MIHLIIQLPNRLQHFRFPDRTKRRNQDYVCADLASNYRASSIQIRIVEWVQRLQSCRGIWTSSLVFACFDGSFPSRSAHLHTNFFLCHRVNCPCLLFALHPLSHIGIMGLVRFRVLNIPLMRQLIFVPLVFHILYSADHAAREQRAIEAQRAEVFDT